MLIKLKNRATGTVILEAELEFENKENVINLDPRVADALEVAMTPRLTKEMVAEQLQLAAPPTPAQRKLSTEADEVRRAYGL